MNLFDLQGKTIEQVHKYRKKNTRVGKDDLFGYNGDLYDDIYYLLVFEDGEQWMLTASGNEQYTGQSEGEYPLDVRLIDNIDFAQYEKV